MKKSKTYTNYITVLAMAVFMVGFTFQTALASIDPQVRMLPNNLNELAQKARPGIVNIQAVKPVKMGNLEFPAFFDSQNPFEGFFELSSWNAPSYNFKQLNYGTGFIIDGEGYIVTNNHVIENADRIKVTLANGKAFDAKMVGLDPKTDLALIKIEASDDLMPLKFGDSGALQDGALVVAMGSTFGPEYSVTPAIFNSKGQELGSGPYDGFIQTDPSINLSHTGGPLINMKGEVVGINTAIMANSGDLGYAVPSNLAKGIIEQLKNNGEVTRGWLGVAIQDLTPELSKYHKVENQSGVLVTEVYEGDPAYRAGIQPRDVIMAVDGKKVRSSHDLSWTIANSPVGMEIPMSILRDGKEMTVVVTLTKRVNPDLHANVKQKLESTDDLGFKLANLKPESALRLGFSENEKGLLVTEVKPGGKAALAGIMEGDLIKEINHTPVKTVEDYADQVEKVTSGETVQLLAKRVNAGFIAVNITV